MPTCTYCGAYNGNHKDHVIPSSYTSFKRTFSVGEIVPACPECNCTLSDKMFVTVAERAAYLYKVYSWKYKDVLAYPVWTDTELEQMSANFQKQIIARSKEKEYMALRMNHLNEMRMVLIEDELDLENGNAPLPARDSYDEEVAAMERERKRIKKHKERMSIQQSIDDILVHIDAQLDDIYDIKEHCSELALRIIRAKRNDDTKMILLLQAEKANCKKLIKLFTALNSL